MSEKDVFATLPAGRRIWAVASVHGETERVRELHSAISSRLQSDDLLVYLGNLMGRGSGVFDTMQEILLFRRAFLARPGADVADVVYLRGSQEEMWHRLLQIQFAINPSEVLKWMFDYGVAATIEAYGSSAKDGLDAASRGAVALTEWTSAMRKAMRASDGHNALMSALRRAAFVEDNSLLFVNAGIDVSRPLSEQFDSFWWGATPFDTIQSPFCGFSRVVRGFDARHRGLNTSPATTSIDAGCGFGGPLLAACFNESGETVDTVEA
ncbi:MAG: hypothetical protein HN403_09105 [Rhodospirillales bacterium]|jgi:serine/threonine protein phosphatase 1|nr:hypothetical protein [Rhodospirillales bacterium]